MGLKPPCSKKDDYLNKGASAPCKNTAKKIYSRYSKTCEMFLNIFDSLGAGLASALLPTVG